MKKYNQYNKKKFIKIFYLNNQTLQTLVIKTTYTRVL